MKPIKLHYSEALVRTAVRAFWWRVLGWRYLAALALVLGGLVSFVWSGDRSWWIGLLAAIFGLGVFFAVALYLIHYRESMIRYRRMGAPEGTLELDDNRFRVSSDIGSSEMAWSAVTEVWQFPEFWLLFLSRSQFMTLPLADLDDEARSLILERAKVHGAKIT